ncbi:type II toxin-antitoxin system VapC family toxin [Microbacterium sp. A93]|uniref:type II toxin-antitoxin system VapC family toxin n=1 Tax=Microbacterium sp. A93 TaxID=3450716 RepID=UPI003F4246C2
MPDVNVLVHAHRHDSVEHEWLAPWLQEHVNADEQLGLADSVISGFVRVTTHPRIFSEPTPLVAALEQIEALLQHPGVTRISAGTRHWEIFSGLCRGADARGNLISDAAHAAVAIEHSATFVTLDRDFARFPGLRWEVPAA